MLNRKLLYIIFASFIFSGELEVDGDLTVTGNIQNQMIDSLLQVIADLQSQITSMQGVSNIYETREYIIPINFTNWNETYNIDLLNLTGNNLEHALIRILDAEYIMGSGDSGIDIVSGLYTSEITILSPPSNNDANFRFDNYYYDLFYNNKMKWSNHNEDLYDKNLYIKNSSPVVANITISVTAQFPN